MMDRISNKFFVVLWICALILTLHVVQGLRQFDSPLHIRGGGQGSSNILQNNPTLTVAILGKDTELYMPNKSSWLDHISIPNCCILVTAESGTVTPIGSISSKTALDADDNDISLVETLAFLCDVVVVFLPKDMSHSEEDPLWNSLVQGATRRKESSLPKGHLFLISSQSMEFSKNDQQIISLFESVETATTNDLPAVLDTFLSKTNVIGGNTISTLFDAKDDVEQDMSLPFTEVIKQVYKSLGPAADEQRELEFRPIPAATTKAISERSTTTTAIHSESTSTKMTSAPPNDTGDVGEPSSSDQDRMVSIWARAQSKLASLETKVEDAMLAVAEESINPKGMPLLFLDFGSLANEILEEAYSELGENERGNIILVKIVGELQRLHRQQVTLMRDYYGRRYENLLDQLTHELEVESITRQEAGERSGAAVDEFVKSFRDASHHAIPRLCRSNDEGEGGELAEVFGDLFRVTDEESTKGLCEDILEATNLRTPVQEDDDMEETAAIPQSRWQKFQASIPKWAKRLLARGLMLGVNYAQGWLAWQGLKRAAAERDRKMPKFPLF